MGLSANTSLNPLSVSLTCSSFPSVTPTGQTFAVYVSLTVSKHLRIRYLREKDLLGVVFQRPWFMVLAVMVEGHGRAELLTCGDQDAIKERETGRGQRQGITLPTNLLRSAYLNQSAQEPSERALPLRL